jgi:hypothetical protein
MIILSNLNSIFFGQLRAPKILETFAFFVDLLNLFLDNCWLREALGVEVFIVIL